MQFQKFCDLFRTFELSAAQPGARKCRKVYIINTETRAAKQMKR